MDIRPSPPATPMLLVIVQFVMRTDIVMALSQNMADGGFCLTLNLGII